MFKFLRKYKLPIDIFSVIVFALGSILYFIEYPTAENKKMKLVSAITFGAMAIIKLVDVVELYLSKRKAE